MISLLDIAADVCAKYNLDIPSLWEKPLATREFHRTRFWPARREFVRRALATGHWSSADVARFMRRDPGTIRALKKAAMRDCECATGGE